MLLKNDSKQINSSPIIDKIYYNILKRFKMSLLYMPACKSLCANAKMIYNTVSFKKSELFGVPSNSYILVKTVLVILNISPDTTGNKCHCLAVQ